MAYDYLDKDKLKDITTQSEEYMQDFWDPLGELERVSRGKPGKVPKGKPRVTTGIMAGIRREKPKEVIQQIPSGDVVIRSNKDLEKLADATLTDIIIPNANSGGTPYDKANQGIKDLYDNGSSWAHVFFNRRGDLFHADWRRVYVKDILFEKGKVSEFDSNRLGIIEWMTEGDVEAHIYQLEQLKKSKEARKEEYSDEDLNAWRELLKHGPQEKEDQYKSEPEKKNSNNNGYFKVIKWMQIGVGANFYRYSPVIDKVLSTEPNKDPRGIIPVHGLVGEPDYANPLGEPLAAISAGKVNLADFDMQMYQYGQGMGYSPTIKKWGETPAGRIKIAPDHVIEMLGTKAEGDDFEVVNIANNAINNYTNNASYITTQIYNEQGGSNDSSISAEAGGVGFSKAPAGIKQQDKRNERATGHLTKLYEQWQGRIFETALNLHFACSAGKKTLELEDETLKRLNLTEDPTMDYDQEFGKIRFSVTAGTSQEEDNDAESEKLVALQEVKNNQQTIDEKFMRMYNQLVKNAGVAEPETLMYTDEEIEIAKKTDAILRQRQLQEILNPPQPTPAPTDPNAAPPVDPNMLPLPDENAIDPNAMPTDDSTELPMDMPTGPTPEEEDRAVARIQLIDRGFSEEEADIILDRLAQQPETVEAQ